MPSPVKNLHKLSMASDGATAFSNEAMPKIVTLASSNGLRPTRSPIGPAVRAPTMTPTLDQTNAVANAGGGKFQTWVSDGTAQPIEPTS
jgi:hypothetical protein